MNNWKIIPVVVENENTTIRNILGVPKPNYLQKVTFFGILAISFNRNNILKSLEYLLKDDD